MAHLKEREQVRRPLGSFQARKHRVADLLVQVDGAHLYLKRAHATSRLFGTARDHRRDA